MKRCKNCLYYFVDYCTRDWDLLDESCKDEERDRKDPDDCCDKWEYNDLADDDENYNETVE